MQIHRDKGHAKKLEIGVMQPQAKGYLELPEAGREKVGFSLSTFREVWLYWSLNFVFVISTTVTKKILFLATKFIVICYVISGK